MIKNKLNEFSKSKTRAKKNLDIITEILGLMEDKGKSKNWLLEEIKRKREPLRVSASKNSVEILKSCSNGFIGYLKSTLNSFDFSVPKVKTLENYHWFFTDIVGSSIPKIETTSQVDKILQVTEQIKRTETFKNSDLQERVVVPTGDGMAIGFRKNPEKPLRLAMELHKAINTYNKKKTPKYQIKIRVGIDTGPVYVIKDLNDRKTFWGPGIIMAKRVMDLCAPMQIVASERIAEDVRNLSPEYRSIFHKMGGYTIKHGNKLVMYTIYGDGFGNKNISKKGKIDSKAIEEQKDTYPFVFNNINVKLDVTDPETMMVHHTWVWEIKNISENSINHISYFLEGDTPREWSALNIKVKDRQKNELQTIIDENKDFRKVFKAQFVKPLKPKKTQNLTMEFDWEEPDRKYGYVISSNCQKFNYIFSIPKGIEIKNRILKVNPGTRNKTYAPHSAKINYLKDKTVVKWAAKSLQPLNEFEFQW